MIIDLIQAHVALAALLFLVLAPFGTGVYLQGCKLALAVTLTFVPVGELTLTEAVRSLTHDVSVSFVVMVCFYCLKKLGLIDIAPADHRHLLWVVGAGAMLLYPASLGLSYLDPYRWGYEPAGLMLATGAIALYFLHRGNTFGATVLTFPALVYCLDLDTTENYWNYLIDPALVMLALLYGLRSLARFSVHRIRTLIATPTLATHTPTAESTETPR
ncbi:hypothetical protein IAE33_001054 [Pseudomonas sp. S60]|uniref:hypothetical protein n=1 Tax=Pseudomonas sp. S60 TaxID=211124 RepID=UPI001911992F|nr:hypothetical protein [Pseudomonas sp. S60]MBK5009194.1 hypothetical protein [Pseudomonas sp. S60]